MTRITRQEMRANALRIGREAVAERIAIAQANAPNVTTYCTSDPALLRQIADLFDREADSMADVHEVGGHYEFRRDAAKDLRRVADVIASEWD